MRVNISDNLTLLGCTLTLFPTSIQVPMFDSGIFNCNTIRPCNRNTILSHHSCTGLLPPLQTFVKEHPAKPHAHSVLLSAGISEEITAHPIKFDEFPLSPPAKPLLSHRSDLTTISENQVKLELHPTTSPDKTGLSVKLSLALSGAENDYSEKSPRVGARAELSYC